MNDKTTQTAPADVSPRKTYRVMLRMWESYRIFIEATSPEEAEEIAEELLDENGTYDFAFKGGGIESFLVDEA